MQSCNPATGQLIANYAPHTPAEIATLLSQTDAGFKIWKSMSFSDRGVYLRRAAVLLRQRAPQLAQLMTAEMGKVVTEGLSEISKCAAACEYFAEHAADLLKDTTIGTEARQSFVTYQPLGPILAIMPWNFPFWQVFRFAAPHLMAGNVGILKHAANVCGCAEAIEAIFHDADFPAGCFHHLRIPNSEIAALIAHPTIAAVTLTGSVAAGRAVAAQAGAQLKKTVLELGGSDAYVVLSDADIPTAANLCANSRLMNAGQSCIAAKRFIVVADVATEFTQNLITAMAAISPDDPTKTNSRLGPLACIDLRDALHHQVVKSCAQGAQLALGGTIPDGPGAFYPPTVLTGVLPGMTAFEEELFGPVAAIITVKDETEAFIRANQSGFGLGSALFTRDLARARQIARTCFDAGQTFVNSIVQSDVRLPFGGIKASGYGRELSSLGIREFVNAKTVSIA